MALKKSEKRLLIIMGIVVLGAAVNFMIEGAAKKKKAALRAAQRKPKQATQVVTGSRDVPVSMAVSVKLDSTVKRYETWGRDPFAPPVRTVASNGYGGSGSGSGKSKKKGHEIKGFFWKSGKAFVLIDDEVFSEGEENDGLIVDKIDGMTVRCREGNRSFTLTWSESL